MAGRLKDETGCEIWIQKEGAEELDHYRDPGKYAAELRETYEDHGISPEESEELTKYEDWRHFVSRVVEADRWLDGDEKVTIGGRDWEFVYTPGHARLARLYVERARQLVRVGGSPARQHHATHRLPARGRRCSRRLPRVPPQGRETRSQHRSPRSRTAVRRRSRARPFDRTAPRTPAGSDTPGRSARGGHRKPDNRRDLRGHLAALPEAARSRRSTGAPPLPEAPRRDRTRRASRRDAPLQEEVRADPRRKSRNEPQRPRRINPDPDRGLRSR